MAPRARESAFDDPSGSVFGKGHTSRSVLAAVHWRGEVMALEMKDQVA